MLMKMSDSLKVLNFLFSALAKLVLQSDGQLFVLSAEEFAVASFAKELSLHNLPAAVREDLVSAALPLEKMLPRLLCCQVVSTKRTARLPTPARARPAPPRIPRRLRPLGPLARQVTRSTVTQPAHPRPAHSARVGLVRPEKQPP